MMPFGKVLLPRVMTLNSVHIYIFGLLPLSSKAARKTKISQEKRDYFERERINLLSEAKTPIALVNGDGSTFSSSFWPSSNNNCTQSRHKRSVKDRISRCFYTIWQKDHISDKTINNYIKIIRVRPCRLFHGQFISSWLLFIIKKDLP